MFITLTKRSLIFLFIFIITPLYADREAPPFPYIVQAEMGQFYFRMVPGKGYAYKLTNGKKDELLWKTEGWYSMRVFLASDGIHLVRLGDWPRGQRPTEKHLAVAFYKNGTLLKSYSTKDLIEDYSQVQKSISHYLYLMEGEDKLGLYSGRDKKLRFYDGVFKLTTIDGIEYKFNIETGKIKSKVKVNN